MILPDLEFKTREMCEDAVNEMMECFEMFLIDLKRRKCAMKL